MSTIPRHTQNVLPPGGRRSRSPFASGNTAPADTTAPADPVEEGSGAEQQTGVTPPAAPAPTAVETTAPADPAGEGSGVEQQREVAPPAAPARTVVETTAPSGAKKAAAVADAKPKQVLLKLPPQDKTRMTRVRTFTAPYTGIESEQEFIRQAIAEKCERYEREFNGGKPYPALASED